MNNTQDATDALTKLYRDKVLEEFAKEVNLQMFGDSKLPKLSKKELEKMRIEQEEKDKKIKRIEKLMKKLDVSLEDLGYEYDY
jgi:uncharacterized protein (UPF0297 family)